MNANIDNKYNRIAYVDILRSGGIIAMIIGHIGFGSLIGHFIHAWHMPLFFLISGYFYKKKNTQFSDYVCRKARSLLIPYFCIGLLNSLIYAITLFINRPSNCHNIFQLVIDSLLDLVFVNYYLPLAGALWFLMALFVANVLYFILDKTISNRYLLLFTVSVLSFIGCTINIFLDFRLPWSLDAAFVGIGFIHIGRNLKIFSQKHNVFSIRLSLLLLLNLICLILIFVNGYVNMRDGVYSNIVLFWFNATLAFIVLWNDVKIVYSFFKTHSCRFFQISSKWIQSIGSDSIIYLCFNQFFIIAITNILEPKLSAVLCKLIVFIITMILLRVLNSLIRKSRFQYIFFSNNRS